MAGIGFRLKHFFQEGSLVSNFQGAIYSIIISSGPWLISVLTIAIVSIVAQKEIGVNNLYILKSIICYSFSVSLILFGAIEMPLTRYIADQLYRNDNTTFRSVFLFMATSFIVIATIIGVIFYSFFDTLSLSIIIFSIGLFAAILLIWLSMNFLSAAKNYHQIIISFIAGGFISVTASIYLGEYFQLTGYVIGYASGQILTAILLSLNIFYEFNTTDYTTLEFTRYFPKHNKLIFIGLFYYLGIWIDKFIFWFGHLGEQVLVLFYTNQYYDTAMFMSYLSIVPSMAIFLVQVETNFYQKYFYYFKSIENKYDLNILDLNTKDIIDSVRSGIYNLVKVQTAVTLLMWYFAEEILDALFLPSIMLPIFRFGLLGAFLQALFLIINIILLYFQNHKKVLLHYFIFFISNALFTYLSIYMDVRYHGIGYLLSCSIVFIISFLALNKHLSLINFYTFMGQPITEE